MGRRPPPRSPHPPLSDPSARLLFAVEKIAHHLEGIEAYLARSPALRPAIPAEIGYELTQLARDLLAPYLRRR